jgi:hypothetical protein
MPFRQTFGRTVERAEPWSNPPLFSIADVLRTLDGDLHILLQTRTTAGEWRLRHVHLAKTDTRTYSVPVSAPTGYTDGYLRIIQDASGGIYRLFGSARALAIQRAADSEGNNYGKWIDLFSALQSRNLVLMGSPYLATPRGGTPPADTIDLLLHAGRIGEHSSLYYMRVRVLSIANKRNRPAMAH